MKINVTENKVSIKEEQILNENEYNIHKIQFDFSSEYTDDLVKVALFSIDNHTYKKIISNNECDIPPEVLTKRGYSILGVYAYKTEQDTLVLRYSPSPTRISVYDGSYKAEAENSEPITPSEIEQYQQILQNSLQQFQNQYNVLAEETEEDIQAIENELQRKVNEGYFDGEDGFSPIAKVIQKSNGATIEIEDKNGKTTADVLNGQDGYSPVRGVDYWTEEDKQEVEEEATQQIEGKIEEYNENATQKTNSFNTNATQKTAAYNENAIQKTQEFDRHTEQIQTNIQILQRTDDEILSNFNKFEETTGKSITLNETIEIKFAKPPLPMGDSEQEGEPSPDNEASITNVIGDVEVLVQNRNLFNPIKVITDSHNQETYITQDGKWIRFKTCSLRLYFYPEGIKENTRYTFKVICKNTTSSNNSIGFSAYYTDGTNNDIIDSGVISDTIEHTYTGVTTSGKTLSYIRSSYTNNEEVFIKIEGTQIEEGTTATSYIPHQEQKFTFPLDNEKLMLGDYLADDGIHHVKGQMTFDGTENFLDEGGFYSLNISNMKLANVGIGLCTHYLNFNIYDNTKSRVRFGWGSTKIYFYDLQHTTLTEFKTFLAEQYQNETPVIAEYELGEETIIPYTSAQQTAYNAIKEAISYEGQTNISGSSSGINPTFNVQAYKSLNQELNNKVDKITGKELSSNDFTDEYKEQVDTNTGNIEDIQEENERLKNTLLTIIGTGQTITLNKTAELQFKKPPLPMGKSEQVQYSGKNLFNLTAEDFQNGETLGVGKKVVLTLKPNTNYTLSSNEPNGTTIDTNIWFNGGSGSENGVGIDRPKTTQTDENGELYISIRTTEINTIFENYWIQLEEGTAATSYEPYVGGTVSPNLDYPQEIINITGDVEVLVKNKNLLPAITGNTVEGIALTQNADGSFIINGTASAGGYKRYLFGKTITFPAGNYTIYFENSALGSNGEISYDIVDIYKDLRFNKAITTTGKHVFYHTINEDLTCTSFNTWVSNGVSINNAQIYMMIISGTHNEEDILKYVKHKEQVFTFPLGNEKLMLGDYLADDGIHHVRGQDVFDGSEDEAWAKIYGSIENGIALYSVDKNHKQVDGLSDKFVMRNSLSIWYNGEGVTTKWRNDKIGFMINGERINNDYSIIAIRNLMNNNPVTVEYELAEEVIVPYTTAQQTVYNAIKQALSYEGQTNISSNQNVIFNVEAYLDTKVILSEKGTYSKPSTGIPKTDLSNAVQTSLNKADTALQSHQDISGKQNITDNTLTTINKTVPTAINEVYSIARGANQALSYGNYQTMITAFNALANDVYNVGQNVMIVTLQVPDLWISGIESTSVPYTYTTDEAFTTALSTNGYVQVGYYKLSALETQKVDLTNYEQNTNKTTTISSSSTNAQYPSAKAVYDYIQSLDGDEVSY